MALQKEQQEIQSLQTRYLHFLKFFKSSANKAGFNIKGVLFTYPNGKGMRARKEAVALLTEVRHFSFFISHFETEL